MKLLKSVIVSAIIALCSFDAFADSYNIKNIDYHGNSRINNDTIYAYLNFAYGEQMTQEKLDASVKSLFDTGFFSDVKISISANTLIVNVVENPLINKIGFDGNTNIEDKDLAKELSLRPNTVFSPYKLHSDINRINTIYQKSGRYSASIQPKMIKLDQNRINLVYEINEGTEAVIRKINFIGNKQFSDSDLSEAIISKEYRFYRFFSSVDVFDSDKLEYDSEMLRRFYQNQGFANANVTTSSAELSAKKDAFLVTFVIDEDKLYYFGEISFESQIKSLTTETLNSIVTLVPGRKFNRELLDSNVDAITTYLGNHGYPFVDIEPIVTTNPETSLADVKFIIKESYKVYINKINIKNNTRTLDKVIRREFRIAEGDPYNISKIQRSKQRIENLGFFSKVDLKNRRTDEQDKLDLDVEVEETSTGSVNFAGGYNTATGILGQITLSEDNFLGKGQQVQIGTTLAQKERNIDFSFTEPYFMDKEIAAGFDIFSSKRNYESLSSFQSENIGFTLRAGYELTEHLAHGLRYSLKQERVTDVSSTASRYVKAQQGKHIVSLVGHTLIEDRLDNKQSPSEGYLLKLEQDFAGLGGNTRYISTRGTAAYFLPVYSKDYTLKLIARGGHIQGYGGKKVSINDAFYVGPDYIRGFEIAGIGPRDKATNDALGGKTYYTGTVEFIMPSGLPNEVGLKIGAFTDAGALFGIDGANPSDIYHSKKIRASAGLMLIWKSPLGTVSLSYGIPYRREKFDDAKRLNIDFGTKF